MLQASSLLRTQISLKPRSACPCELPSHQPPCRSRRDSGNCVARVPCEGRQERRAAPKDGTNPSLATGGVVGFSSQNIAFPPSASSAICVSAPTQIAPSAERSARRRGSQLKKREGAQHHRAAIVRPLMVEACNCKPLPPKEGPPRAAASNPLRPVSLRVPSSSRLICATTNARAPTPFLGPKLPVVYIISG